MNIILPIGGVGQRFKEENYNLPKPLIKALGKPVILWVLDSLKTELADTIFIVYRAEFSQHNFTEIIRSHKPNSNLVFIPLYKDTEGASDTVRYALQSEEMKAHLHKETIIVDSDSYTNTDILKKFRGNKQNMIFTFTDTKLEAKYSYIKEDNGVVTDIKEKMKISDSICIGSYGFSSGKFLLDVINKMILEGVTKKYAKEFYISSVYTYILEKLPLDPIYNCKVDDFVCLGTPIQLQDFCCNYSNSPKYRFCFDLDNTLVTYPTVEKDYNSVKPISKNIEFLRKLYEGGHTIIIYTARHMKTQQGNVGGVMAKVGKSILKNLEDFNIPYHELYLGKPYANFYIDDLAFNAYENLEKSLGFYNLNTPLRNHHKSLEMGDTVVTKKSSNIDGEIYWYSNIPKNITKLFPTLYQTDKIIEKTDPLPVYKLVIQRIKGIPLSYMLINKTLTRNHISQVIGCISEIHNSLEKIKALNTDELYSVKFLKRTNCGHDFSKYEKFNEVQPLLLKYLKEYETKIFDYTVIHGDPVLTNVLLDLDGNLKFIDMKGKRGNKLTIYGDPLYDWAKLYQSLCGYEFILHDREIDESYLQNLREVFELNFISIPNALKYIKLITASLFITLIPLHSNVMTDKTKRYYERAIKILL
jgi:capsule biosynthesis phosphatase